ncbi:MAG: M24 family metallopeptidase, partial [Lachnospiraceae bacterium]|nr:M24 family metallopeptidase [Lachnospiraceae bacterium]
MSIRFRDDDACWCGSGKMYVNCHKDFDARIKRARMQMHKVPSRDMIKTPAQVEKIKESAKINVAVLDYISERICEGMPTSDIDKMVYEQTTKMGGIPAPLNYEGFPYSVCTSVNNQVCHGFPSDKVILKSGD